VLGKGGYWSGAATMVAGPSGIGKTLMGLPLPVPWGGDGRARHPGHLPGERDSADTRRRELRLEGRSSDVHILSRSVVDVYIDEWVYQLLDLIEKTKARRIVIDSLPDVMTAAADPTRFREWMFSLTQRLERAGISMMMIVEVPELFQLRRISEQGLSHLADNVVLLQYVQEGPELVRALTVLKTRAMHHHPVVHRYEITEKGFVLGDVLSFTR